MEAASRFGKRNLKNLQMVFKNYTIWFKTYLLKLIMTCDFTIISYKNLIVLKTYNLL